MKVSMRPSGESAGEVAESAKLVSCVYSRRAGTSGLWRRDTISALAAASVTTVKTTAAAHRIRRTGSGDTGTSPRVATGPAGANGNSGAGVVTGAVRR